MNRQHVFDRYFHWGMDVCCRNCGHPATLIAGTECQREPNAAYMRGEEIIAGWTEDKNVVFRRDETWRKKRLVAKFQGVHREMLADHNRKLGVLVGGPIPLR